MLPCPRYDFLCTGTKRLSLQVCHVLPFNGHVMSRLQCHTFQYLYKHAVWLNIMQENNVLPLYILCPCIWCCCRFVQFFTLNFDVVWSIMRVTDTIISVTLSHGCRKLVSACSILSLCITQTKGKFAIFLKTKQPCYLWTNSLNIIVQNICRVC